MHTPTDAHHLIILGIQILGLSRLVVMRRKVTAVFGVRYAVAVAYEGRAVVENREYG